MQGSIHRFVATTFEASEWVESHEYFLIGVSRISNPFIGTIDTRSIQGSIKMKKLGWFVEAELVGVYGGVESYRGG